MGFSKTNNPVTALTDASIEFIQKNKISGNVLNSYNLGDQLAYHFYPTIRISIDSRIDMYGEKLYKKNRRLNRHGFNSELLEFLNKYKIATIIMTRRKYDKRFSKATPQKKNKDYGWKIVYYDEKVVILRRI